VRRPNAWRPALQKYGKYFEKALIDVAVPYSPGGQAIFVIAQIAYGQELPEQKMYRCGVMYVRSGK
jgi:hypothetical protein